MPKLFRQALVITCSLSLVLNSGVASAFQKPTPSALILIKDTAPLFSNQALSLAYLSSGLPKQLTNRVTETFSRLLGINGAILNDDAVQEIPRMKAAAPRDVETGTEKHLHIRVIPSNQVPVRVGGALHDLVQVPANEAAFARGGDQHNQSKGPSALAALKELELMISRADMIGEEFTSSYQPERKEHGNVEEFIKKFGAHQFKSGPIAALKADHQETPEELFGSLEVGFLKNAKGTNKEISQQFVQHWLTSELAKILLYDQLHDHEISRSELDKVFETLYKPGNPHNLLNHPADIGRVAIGMFMPSEHQLFSAHKAFLEFFDEKNGENPYAAKLATDLGRHIRYILSFDDKKRDKERLINGVDYAMALLVLDKLLPRYEQLQQRAPNDPARNQATIALIDLLSADPEVLTNRKKVENISHSKILEHYEPQVRHYEGDARWVKPNQSTPIPEMVMVDNLPDGQMTDIYARLDRLGPFIRNDIHRLRSKIDPISDEYSPLQRKDVFFIALLSALSVRMLSAPLPLNVDLLDDYSQDPQVERLSEALSFYGSNSRTESFVAPRIHQLLIALGESSDHIPQVFKQDLPEFNVPINLRELENLGVERMVELAMLERYIHHLQASLKGSYLQETAQEILADFVAPFSASRVVDTANRLSIRAGDEGRLERELQESEHAFLKQFGPLASGSDYQKAVLNLYEWRAELIARWSNPDRLATNAPSQKIRQAVETIDLSPGSSDSKNSGRTVHHHIFETFRQKILQVDGIMYEGHQGIQFPDLYNSLTFNVFPELMEWHGDGLSLSVTYNVIGLLTLLLPDVELSSVVEGDKLFLHSLVQIVSASHTRDSYRQDCSVKLSANIANLLPDGEPLKANPILHVRGFNEEEVSQALYQALAKYPQLAKKLLSPEGHFYARVRLLNGREQVSGFDIFSKPMFLALREDSWDTSLGYLVRFELPTGITKWLPNNHPLRLYPYLNIWAHTYEEAINDLRSELSRYPEAYERVFTTEGQLRGFVDLGDFKPGAVLKDDLTVTIRPKIAGGTGRDVTNADLIARESPDPEALPVTPAHGSDEDFRRAKDLLSEMLNTSSAADLKKLDKEFARAFDADDPTQDRLRDGVRPSIVKALASLAITPNEAIQRMEESQLGAVIKFPVAINALRDLINSVAERGIWYFRDGKSAYALVLPGEKWDWGSGEIPNLPMMDVYGDWDIHSHPKATDAEPSGEEGDLGHYDFSLQRKMAVNALILCLVDATGELEVFMATKGTKNLPPVVRGQTAVDKLISISMLKPGSVAAEHYSPSALPIPKQRDKPELPKAQKKKLPTKKQIAERNKNAQFLEIKLQAVINTMSTNDEGRRAAVFRTLNAQLTEGKREKLENGLKRAGFSSGHRLALLAAAWAFASDKNNLQQIPTVRKKFDEAIAAFNELDADERGDRDRLTLFRVSAIFEGRVSSLFTQVDSEARPQTEVSAREISSNGPTISHKTRRPEGGFGTLSMVAIATAIFGSIYAAFGSHGFAHSLNVLVQIAQNAYSHSVIATGIALAPITMFSIRKTNLRSIDAAA